MKNKNLVLVIGILAGVLILVAGYLLWNTQTQKEVQVQKETNVPSSLEKYYQEASPSPQTVSQLKNVSDLDSLSKEIDSISVDIDSGLKQLDSDFASF
jgi:Tfp pilus assembly protein PilO